MGLGFVGGYADAAGYLHWSTFGANMTGNTVLFAISLFQRSAGAMKPLVPIVAFFLGAMLAGVLLYYTRPELLLVIEAALLVVAAFSRGYVPQLGFLALAMGIQNNSVSQFGVVRANTSFITGDYSQVARALAQILLGRASPNDRGTVAIVAPLIFSYAFGAFAAAVCGRFTDLSLLFVVPVVLALAYAVRRGALA